MFLYLTYKIKRLTDGRTNLLDGKRNFRGRFAPKRNTLGTHYLSQYFFFRYVGHNAEAGGLSVHHLQ